MGHTGWFAYRPMPSVIAGASITEPTEATRPELADVGRLARKAMRRVVATARSDERATLSKVLREHLGADAQDLAVVDESWRPYEHVNVQVGLDAWLDAPSRVHHAQGVMGFQHHQFGLAELMDPTSGVHNPFGPRPGNLARTNRACGPDGQVMACVMCAVYLVTDGDRRTALLLRAVDPESGMTSLQIASTEEGFAAQAAEEIRASTVAHNVFRGQVLSFGGEVFGPSGALLNFHKRTTMDAGQLILPPETRKAIERQVVGVARHSEELLQAGQHLKRGLLLYGPPGVGKTHTVRFLTGDLIETTVIQLSGTALHLISEACSVARTLQPAMVVVEDVDLIAEERGMHPGQHPLLFQLLNEMDGLAEDADVVFVLTTNRADVLEPALAQRPGRVDQAVELTVPDDEARRALFHLYRGNLQIDDSRLDDVISRMEGVTAAFIKELVRRAAVHAAEGSEDSQPLVVSADQLDAALDELLDTRNAMTRVLLGGTRED